MNGTLQLEKKNHARAFFVYCLCEEPPRTPSKPVSCGLLSVLNLLFTPKTVREQGPHEDVRDFRTCRIVSSVWHWQTRAFPWCSEHSHLSSPWRSVFCDTSAKKKSFLWIHPSEVNLFIPAASARVDFATALIIGDEQQREPSFRHLEHKAGPFFPLSGNCTHKARGWFLCPHAQSVSLAALIRLECRSEQGSI